MLGLEIVPNKNTSAEEEAVAYIKKKILKLVYSVRVCEVSEFQQLCRKY